MSFQKRVAQFFQKKLWPWNEIWRLRHNLEMANAAVDSCRRVEATHRGKWMAEANQFWGPNKFTDGEEATMVRFYEKGYGWREALSMLREYCGYDSRYTGVKR